MDTITSLQNPKIKNLLRLQQKSSERRSQGLVVVEGARELMIALNEGYVPESVYVCPELYARSEYPDLLPRLPERLKTEVSLSVFQRLAYREGSDGVLSLIRPKPCRLEDMPLSDNPFLIVLEAVEKPGNLGAILRTADAARADGVLVCDPLTDIYNPNVIRSSIGCVFSVPVAVCTSQEAYDWMKSKGIRIHAAELRASEWYHHCDYTRPSAVVMGTEADGLSPFWIEKADQRIKIPMRGMIDSLNVSVSTAVLAFEAMRQRDFK